MRKLAPQPIHSTGAWAASVVRTSKLTAPDFDRLARTPCPIASLASSGITALSSLFARLIEKSFPRVAEECRKLGPRVRRAHIDNADGLDARPWRLGHGEVRYFAGLDAAPEFLFRRHQNGEIERVHRYGDLDAFAAAGNDGEHRAT